MRIDILIGGKAGQGINKISEIVSGVLNKYGYFTFNYKDYPSLIRGGHNFNILTLSEKRVGSNESQIDIILALDNNTAEIHKKDLKKGGIIIRCDKFCDIGKNLNVTLAGMLIKMLGIPVEYLVEEIKNELGADNTEAIEAGKIGFKEEKVKFNLKKLNNKIEKHNGSEAMAIGAVNSKVDICLGYPMTPATNFLHELASYEKEYGHIVFEPENEISVVNAAIGASFAGAKTIIATSGGGFDLMTEGLSFQGMAEIPLVCYLASRPGPGTGIPTYSLQDDLDVALRGGHGEFPRVVIAPGDPIEAIEKTNEAFYLAEKFNVLSIILGDKHLAESEFSTNKKPNKILDIKVSRKVPGNGIIRATSYEHEKSGHTTESGEIAKISADLRIKKYNEIKKESKKFEMIKIYGNPNAKNLVIGWGSTKTVILDAIDSIDNSINEPKKGDYKFLQVLYLKPISDDIIKEIKKAKKVILVEQNVTGQLGRLIREKTGIKIENRILKYDTRPFTSDLLKKEILKAK